MINQEEIKSLRLLIEQIVQTMPDEEAIQMTTLHTHWSENSVSYKSGTRVQYNGVLYKVLVDHISQKDWTPENAPSLFAKVLIPDAEQINTWEQPNSTNPYMAGDKVTHNEKIWISDIDNNVWEPGIYGWTEVTGGTSKK